ncbi:MAG: site-specific integrase [Leptolyngbyaceae cyanobacterium RU_5_1]|nr:site-specific integrase [Leptolyngbyaceae cyanobacterium RU_5_1]
MPKVDRNGQALVLTPTQLDELWTELKHPHRLITQICYYTAARVGEVCSLQAQDVIGSEIIYRARNTKTDTTRTIAIARPLAQILTSTSLPTTGYLFPGKYKGSITTQSVDLALRQACDYLGFKGVSTHSFRRSLLTHLYRAGHSLRTLQQISGHSDIGNLARYLDCDRDEATKALMSFWNQ